MNMKKFLCCALSASFLGGPTGFAYKKKGQAGQNYGVSRRKVRDRIRHKKKIKDPTGLGSKSQRLGQSKEKSVLKNAAKFVIDHKNALFGTVLGFEGLVGVGVGGYKFINSDFGLYVLSKYIKKFEGGRQNSGVYRCKHRIFGWEYVFKCVDKEENQKCEKFACEKLRKCGDKRIKAPMRCMTIDGKFWSVSEVAPGKRLEDYAVDISNCTYKEKLIKSMKIIKQLCEIQLVLFENGVSHGDLNTGNWFINEENGEPVVYVIDFGRCYETKGKCYLETKNMAKVEAMICDYTYPFISSSGKGCYFEVLETRLDNFFKSLSKEICNEKYKMKNHIFGRFFDVLGFGCFNPSLSDNGCMSSEEIYDLFSDGKGGHLSDEDPEWVRRFIDYLDKKISEISKMGDNVVENICPCTEVSSKNINDFILNEKLNCTNYCKEFNKLCLKCRGKYLFMY